MLRSTTTRGTLAALALLGLATLPQTVRAQTTVVPSDFAATAGNTGSTTVLGSTDRTYQMQVAASKLGTLSVGSVINGLSFRVTSAVGLNVSSVATTFTNWDLTLARASNPITGMSTTFANNMTNPISVRSGALTLAAGAYTGGGNPNAFGTVISFTTPYTYQGGDLVIHISHTGGSASAGSMDSLTNLASGFGIDYAAMRAEGYNAATASLTNATFTITQLSFTPGSAAPEPGTLALLALGIAGGVVAQRRRK